MAEQSISIPLNVNVSTADPNEKVKELSRIPEYRQSALSSGIGAPSDFDHTINNGIHAESGITNTQLAASGNLGGSYNFLTDNGKNIKLSPNGNDPTSGAPINSLYINEKFIDNVPAHGLSSIQKISGQYDDMILTDSNPIGMKVLSNSLAAPIPGTGGASWSNYSNAAVGNIGPYAHKIATGNGRVVAMGAIGTTGTPMVSNDNGATWTVNPLPSISVGWSNNPKICFGNGLFLATSGWGSIYGSPNSAISTDASTWSTVSLPGYAVVDVSLCNTLFIACHYVNAVGQPLISVSNDLSSWTSPVLSSTSGDIAFCAAYGNGKYVVLAIGSSNSYSYTSSDGVNWTKNTIATGTSFNFDGIVFANGLFVSFFRTGTGVPKYSTDGITWSTGTLPSASYVFNPTGPVYGNGVFVCGCTISTSSVPSVIYSTDGINWSFASSSTWAVHGYVTAYINNRFIAVPINGASGDIIVSSLVTLSSVSTIRLDEIDSSGSILNTNTYSLVGFGFGRSICLVRQSLGNSFTYASTQSFLIADSATTYNIVDTSGTKLLTTSISTSWAGSSPQNIWCAYLRSGSTWVAVAQGAASSTNPTVLATASSFTVYSYSWAVMQSRNGYNRVLLSGQQNSGITSSNLLCFVGSNSFTSAFTGITANTTDNSADSLATSCYAYLDVAHASNNHYYSSYLDPSNSDTDANARGLFKVTSSSQGLIRGFGRISWANTADYGSSSPFEFRVMMAPLYSASTSTLASTTGGTVTGSQPVGISVASTYDLSGNVPMGVPLTPIGEFDIRFAPQIGASWDKCLWRYNGAYYLASISTTPSNPIQKISSRLYKINTISPVNVIDSIDETLNLGSNDFTGGSILSSGANSGGIEIVSYGKYANTVDYGLSICSIADATTVVLPGFNQPSCHISFGYYNAIKYTNIGTAQTGAVIQDSSGRAISSSTLTASAFNSINTNPTYLKNPVIPTPLGAIYSGEATANNSSASSAAFEETYFTSGYPNGGVVLSSDYDGYILGNAIGVLSSVFTLFSTTYVFDGSAISIANFSSGNLNLPLEKCITADGLTYMTVSPTVAFFLSSFDNSLVFFDGGRTLTKARRFNLLPKILAGAYNVRDSSIIMDAQDYWVFIRDGLVTVNQKEATQKLAPTRLYSTQSGLFVGSDSNLWQYAYDPSQIKMPSGVSYTIAPVPIDFQSAFYGIGSNELGRNLSYYVTIYSKARVKTAVKATLYTFNQDEQKGMVFQDPQPSIVNINPSYYDDSGYFRFQILPRYEKTLASSLRIQCPDKVTVTELIVRYEDEGIRAIYSPQRRATT